jgi:ABC-2 type transport system permease protein
MNFAKFKMLVQREVWEHKVPLLWTPAIISVLFIVLSVFAYFAASNHFDDLQNNAQTLQFHDGRVSADQLVAELKSSKNDERQKVLLVWWTFCKAPFDLLLLFLVPFYCIASLFDERKDRSIYFWRSLPVSDTESLLAKLFTTILLYPAAMLVATVALQIVTLLLASLGAIKVGLPAWPLIWESNGYIAYVVGAYFDYVLMMLWSLPFIGLLMVLASATRRPFVWAVIPWPLLILVEKWFFDSHQLASWLGQRIQGTFAILYSGVGEKLEHNAIRLGADADAFSDLTRLLSHGQFWFGIVLGVVLLVASVHLRRRIQDV